MPMRWPRGSTSFRQCTPEGVERLIAVTLHAFGRIDVLVNNAVVRHFSPIETFAVDDWNKALAVNLSAPFHAIRLTLPRMKAAGWGRIVNIASIFGFFAVPDRVDYVTTKTALIGLSRAVAVEALPFGVTCNAICPGTVLTPATRDRVAALARRENLTPEEASKAFLAVVSRQRDSSTRKAWPAWSCSCAARTAGTLRARLFPLMRAGMSADRTISMPAASAFLAKTQPIRHSGLVNSD
jgi:NAD(P)-dependent dehydrogenase (short-subunit alcohol dehydrogenase family)